MEKSHSGDPNEQDSQSGGGDDGTDEKDGETNQHQQLESGNQQVDSSTATTTNLHTGVSTQMSISSTVATLGDQSDHQTSEVESSERNGANVRRDNGGRETLSNDRKLSPHPRSLYQDSLAQQPGAHAVAGISSTRHDHNNNSIDDDGGDDHEADVPFTTPAQSSITYRESSQETDHSDKSTIRQNTVAAAPDTTNTIPPVPNRPRQHASTISTSTPPTHQDDTSQASNRRPETSSLPNEEDPLPIAEEYDPATTIIQAELVIPAISALHVTIDEETGQSDRSRLRSSMSPLEIEQARSSHSYEGRNGNDDDDDDDDKSENSICFPHKKRYSLFFSVALAFLMVILVFSIGVPIRKRRSGASGLLSPSTAPTQAPTYSYTCYSSTLEILEAQFAILQDYEPGTTETYVICPNTVIHLGRFKSPSQGDFTVVDGDYPLQIMRENIVIQCGLDGRHENNCTIEGGFIQVLLLHRVAIPGGDFVEVSQIDNATIRGFTFTGEIVSTGPIDGYSVTVGAKGSNLRFEDCTWINLIAQSGLITVSDAFGDLVDKPLENNSVDVTFSGCRFQWIVYDAPLIEVSHQSIVIEDSTFRNIYLSFLVQDKCQVWDLDFQNGCAGLLWCNEGSSCSMQNVCLADFEYHGPSLVYTSNETTAHFENLVLYNEDESCEWSVFTANNEWEDQICNDIFSETKACPIPNALR